MTKLPEGWIPWQPKPNALPLDQFPSEQQLSAWREKVPADLYVMDYKTREDTVELGYKVRDMIPTREGVAELQATPLAIVDPDYSVSDLIKAYFELQVDKRYGTVYGIDPEGMASSLTGGNDDHFYGRMTDLEGTNHLDRRLRKLFSKQEMFQPFNQRK